MNKIYKVGIYLRLSNEDRDKLNKLDDSESIKNQRNMLIDYINKHKDFLLINEYCDENLSGAGTYRPEFERLINDCKNHVIDIVLCKSQSRFSRDIEIIEKYINNKFKEWNIRFISISDNIDTDIVNNKKTRQINGLVNEWYLEDVSNNIRSAFNTKMKQGELISPFAPYGYIISPENNNKLIIDNEASKIVKIIYKLYLEGYGYTKIAKYLNEQNIPSPSLYKYQKGIKLNIISNKPREEIKWNPNAIKTILTNEAYVGNLIQGKRTTISYKNHKIIKKNKSDWIKKINTHNPIIDENIFNSVQLAIKERTKPIRKTGKVHIFSGKVICYECNNIMRKKNSSYHEYLVCQNVNNCTNKLSIRYDELMDIILKIINIKIKKSFNEKELTELLNTYYKSKYTSEIRFLNQKKITIKNNIKKNKLYLKNIYEDKVNNIININIFNELINYYNKNEDMYQNQLLLINTKISNLNKEYDIKKIISKYKQIKELNKIIIDEFIDKIYVGKENNSKTRNIYIKWKTT